ncbi:MULTISPECIES: glycosyltransferase family 4 protein [unclassified Thioalkalivibrio]|uniref:glycosyltransferase family 4 protein n=1 Tax=unclassified Thioalkalivibrio TaxID=2621013 RepID=UPI000370F4A5|nr:MULTISPECIES: glycosyltransferase family 4 protein [unclassified Thioalkalivibrio]
MKILYHHRTRGEDAQGIHIQSLCDAFRELGHEVHMVAPLQRRAEASNTPVPARNEEGDGDARPTLKGVPIPFWFYELLSLAYNGPAFVLLLWAVLRHRPAFIYERYSLFSFSGRLVAWLTRRPLVLEVNAPLSLELQTHGDLVLRRLAQRIEDWLCRSATRTIVVTQAMADIFAARGVPRERLMVMPNGVDGARFNPQVDGRSVRERYVPADARVVGFVGWIRPWHGVDGLIHACAALTGVHPSLHLLIVGDGPAVPALQKLVVDLDLAERVHFTGPVERVAIPTHIAALDIAVQPDVTDYASPIKLFEYLALGRAVVAPDKPNIREVVRHDSSALLFPPRDWGALAERLDALLADDAARVRLGRQAATLVEERGYTWQANARHVIASVCPADASARDTA